MLWSYKNCKISHNRVKIGIAAHLGYLSPSYPSRREETPTSLSTGSGWTWEEKLLPRLTWSPCVCTPPHPLLPLNLFSHSITETIFWLHHMLTGSQDQDPDPFVGRRHYYAYTHWPREKQKKINVFTPLSPKCRQFPGCTSILSYEVDSLLANFVFHDWMNRPSSLCCS